MINQLRESSLLLLLILFYGCEHHNKWFANKHAILPKLYSLDFLIAWSNWTDHLSLILFLIPARIPDSSPVYLVSSRRTSRTWNRCTGHLVFRIRQESRYILLVSSPRTWPFRRILARLNFSLCLTLGLRSIFFLFGVSPLFLAIFASQNKCTFTVYD